MKKLILALAVFALVMAPLAGMADTCYVYVTGDDLKGSRSSAPGGGVIGNNAWEGGNFTIAWEVTGGNGAPYKYEYTITALGQQGGLSHWIMQVTPGLVFTSGPTGDFGALFGPDTWGPAAGNPGFPEGKTIYGYKFNDTLPVNGVTKITFETYNAPVWGDFYAKGGGGQTDATFAYNAYIGLSACDAMDFLGYIVVPDSVQAPIPGSLVLLGSGLLGLVGLRRKLQ